MAVIIKQARGVFLGHHERAQLVHVLDLGIEWLQGLSNGREDTLLMVLILLLVWVVL